MKRYNQCSTTVDIDCDLEGEINDYNRNNFENDAWTLPIEEFKKKWNVINIRRLGKHLCRAGYMDKLNPENSYVGHNPKLIRYLEELDRAERK